MIVLAGRTLRDRRAALLVSFTLPPLALMLGLSLLSRAQANWAAPAYIAATILVVAWLLAEGRRIVIVVSIALHVVAALVVAVGLRNIAAVAGVTLPVKYDPLHRLQGWRSLGRAITVQMAQHPGVILMADDRELLAALMFYVTPHPLNALEWDPGGAIHDQFELTQQPALDRGADFLLVSQNPRNVPAILARFAVASPPQTITIFIGRSGAVSAPAEQRHYTIYFLKGFQGFP
jgi:hypothetical protein